METEFLPRAVEADRRVAPLETRIAHVSEEIAGGVLRNRAAQVETEPIDTLRLSLTLDLASGQIDGTVENAEDVLPETPDLPELDA